MAKILFFIIDNNLAWKIIVVYFLGKAQPREGKELSRRKKSVRKRIFFVLLQPH